MLPRADRSRRAMRICYVCEHDAADPDLLSGRPAAMLAQLERHFEVIRAFPLDRRARYLCLKPFITARLAGQTYDTYREPVLLRTIGWQVQRMARQQRARMIVVSDPRVISYRPYEVVTDVGSQG